MYNIQLIRLLYYLRSTMYKVMEQFEDTEISASKCDGIIQGNDWQQHEQRWQPIDAKRNVNWRFSWFMTLRKILPRIVVVGFETVYYMHCASFQQYRCFVQQSWQQLLQWPRVQLWKISNSFFCVYDKTIDATRFMWGIIWFDSRPKLNVFG